MTTAVARPAPRPVAKPYVYHEPCLDMMSDIGSLGHIALGWLAGSLDAAQALAVFAIFSGYQVSQTPSGESWGRVGGELLEFGIGLLLAKATR